MFWFSRSSPWSRRSSEVVRENLEVRKGSELDVVMLAYNSSTWQTGGRITSSSRSAWAT